MEATLKIFNEKTGEMLAEIDASHLPVRCVFTTPTVSAERTIKVTYQRDNKGNRDKAKIRGIVMM